ncbi:hypothetical protein SELMODRAFT_417562 [Selaginella moellendorffii]|uniref:Uncharacterized protein n=1 Tax=Selaginella moellendorffii TaxID=88036 RepID=D8S2V4_SELML|nr:hypothetical protein SELMODRAFT_417562 [Selaginella moellendorffii]
MRVTVYPSQEKPCSNNGRVFQSGSKRSSSRDLAKVGRDRGSRAKGFYRPNLVYISVLRLSKVAGYMTKLVTIIVIVSFVSWNVLPVFAFLASVAYWLQVQYKPNAPPALCGISCKFSAVETCTLEAKAKAGIDALTASEATIAHLADSFLVTDKTSGEDVHFSRSCRASLNDDRELVTT